MPIKPAVRVTDDHTCPLTVPKPHVKGPVIAGSPNVDTNSLAQARLEDALTCVGVPTTDKIVSGAWTVEINGKCAARVDEQSQHGGKLVKGSPNVDIGGPTAALLGTPGRPDVIIIPKELCKQMNSLWGKSLPAGTSQEHGGTLTRDANGNVRMVNQGSGTAGTFPPNRSVPSGQNTFGIFHTHPYSAAEGGYTNVSLSGGDAGYMINNGDSFMMAQSGQGQYGFVRTPQTPASVDQGALDAANNARISQLVGQGKSFDEASRIAARETAKANNLDYYEGKDCVLTKVK